MTNQQRILLVEDEESLQKLIQLNLEMEGYEVLSKICEFGGMAQGLLRTADFLSSSI